MFIKTKCLRNTITYVAYTTITDHYFIILNIISQTIEKMNLTQKQLTH